MEHNTEYKILHLDSKDYDQEIDLIVNDNACIKYTYYFKNPIVLNDNYDLSVNTFSVKKLLTGNSIAFDGDSTTLRGLVASTNLELNLTGNFLFSNDVEDVIILKNDASKTPTSARIKIGITRNFANTAGCTISLIGLTTPDTGFSRNELVLIDKEQFIGNEFTYTNRYAVFNITSLLDQDLEVRNNTNYGFGSTLDTFTYIPPNGSGTIIVLEIYQPSGFAPLVRIKSVNNSALDYVSGGTIEVPNADVRSLTTGLYGWAKSANSGNLILDIVDVTSVSSNGKKYNIKVDNLKFTNNYYNNSDNIGEPNLINFDIINHGIYNNKNILTLCPQIINNISLLVDGSITPDENFKLSLLLKKK